MKLVIPVEFTIEELEFIESCLPCYDKNLSEIGRGNVLNIKEKIYKAIQDASLKEEK